MKDSNFSSYSGTLIKNDSLDNILAKTKIDNKTKIQLIEGHFREIMEILELDLEDDSLKDTPRRVAKMYVNEIFSGLNSENKPSISLFENNYNYNEMILVKNITLFSTCEHHLVPIIGKVHIGYYASEYVIGLSKINRIVQYFARRPQQQEKLTVQVAQELISCLGTYDVAVYIEADHLCVKSRGVNDVNSITITSSYNGKFLTPDIKNEFITALKR